MPRSGIELTTSRLRSFLVTMVSHALNHSATETVKTAKRVKTVIRAEDGEDSEYAEVKIRWQKIRWHWRRWIRAEDGEDSDTRVHTPYALRFFLRKQISVYLIGFGLRSRSIVVPVSSLFLFACVGPLSRNSSQFNMSRSDNGTAKGGHQSGSGKRYDHVWSVLIETSSIRRSRGFKRDHTHATLRLSCDITLFSAQYSASRQLLNFKIFSYIWWYNKNMFPVILRCMYVGDIQYCFVINVRAWFRPLLFIKIR